MGKKLLGIVGSPRKSGNSEIVVKEIYKQLPEGWDLELMRLPELDIRPCRACYRCLFGDMECAVKDDFPFALQALADSDAYVVAAPTYFLGANASLKRFLDRGLSFYGRVDALWGKPAVGVAVAGIPGLEGATRLNVESFIKLTLGDLRGMAVIYGALPGEIFLEDGSKAVARDLAGALLHGPQQPAFGVPVCPLCGGDTFRFLPGGGLRCMLCSNSGRYEWRDGVLHAAIDRGDHPLFLTIDDVKRHADWLREMKDRFSLLHKDLKAVTREYSNMGTWLRPEKGNPPPE